MPFPPKKDKSLENAFSRRFKQIVERHLGDPEFDIAAICAQLGLSRSQVHRKLKKSTGASTSVFIRSIRLEKGKEMLLDSSLPVSEVAFKVGFKDPSYFTRAFTRKFGKPPSAFRKGVDGKGIG